LLAIYVNEKEVSFIEEKQEGILIFDRTPLYAESGGQTGDTGLGKSDALFFKIENTRKADTGAFLHLAQMKKGTLTVGDKVYLTVDRKRRKNIAVHHSMTHLLHSALREVLGLHVKQAGSYVGPDKLRFDFTHFKFLNWEEIEKIESIINQKIRENIEIRTNTLAYEEAIERGAIAIFEEKYTDVVRMLSIGAFSKELCGGTHLHFTGEAGIFKIINESSISSGIRRIEAVAGEPGFLYIREILNHFHKIQTHFRQKEIHLFDFLKTMEKNIKEREKQLKKQQEAKTQPNLNQLIDGTITIDEVKTTIAHIENLDRKQLSTLADEIKDKTKGIAVLSTNVNGKSAIIISMARGLGERLNANTLVKEIARTVNGNGGGRRDFAQAGGDSITDAFNFKKHTTDIISGHLR